MLEDRQLAAALVVASGQRAPGDVSRTPNVYLGRHELHAKEGRALATRSIADATACSYDLNCDFMYSLRHAADLVRARLRYSFARRDT